jgi:hypothetical protein
MPAIAAELQAMRLEVSFFTSFFPSAAIILDQ